MGTERRLKEERRGLDAGPPFGVCERRRRAERRLPDATEAELTADDFAKYFGASAKITTNVDYQLDQAAEVFDRVRDGY